MQKLFLDKYQEGFLSIFQFTVQTYRFRPVLPILLLPVSHLITSETVIEPRVVIYKSYDLKSELRSLKHQHINLNKLWTQTSSGALNASLQNQIVPLCGAWRLCVVA